MKLSCLHLMVGEVSLVEAFDTVQEAGFDGIDLRGDLATGQEDQVRAQIDRTGLTVPTIYGRITTPLLAATVAERIESVELVRSRLRTAHAIGADNLIVVPIFGQARISVDLGSGVEATELAVLFTLLAELASEAAELGVRIILEPLNRNETHLLTSPSRTAELTRRLGSPSCATMIDTYHTDLEGQDPVEEFTAAKDQVSLIHLSDRNRLLPGQGGIAFAGLLNTLESSGYDGWMGLECTGSFSGEQLADCVTWLRAEVATSP